MRIIDAHVHVGLESHCENVVTDLKIDLINTYEHTLKLMDKNGIEKAILLPIPHKDFEVVKCNNYVYEAYIKHPERFIPFCRIDNNLEQNIARGFKGAKLHFLYENIDIKNIKKELRLLEDAGVPIIVHALFKNKVKQVKEIIKIAPNLVIILAHMGRGHIYTDEGVIENAVALKKYDNVYFETSTVGKIDSIINVCDIIGDQRVLFGSDYPFGVNWFRNKMEYDYSMELSIFNDSIDHKILENIFYNNIVELLNLTSSNKVLVRRAKKNDLDQINCIFENIDDSEKKFLALDSKLTLIKQLIKRESHSYVACINDKVVGFMRESGRPEGYSLLEELVVHPDFRKRGIAAKMLKHYHNIFNRSQAKTNAKNSGMIMLLQKYGYNAKNPEAPRIINWERSEDQL